MFLDREHPCFSNFDSIIPVDVIGVKLYVNIFLDPAGVLVRVLINKLYLVPIVSGRVDILRNSRGLGTSKLLPDED